MLKEEKVNEYLKTFKIEFQKLLDDSIDAATIGDVQSIRKSLIKMSAEVIN